MSAYKDIKVNFANLEDLEVRLIDMAQDLSVTGDEAFQKTLGRALKCLAPAWVGFLAEEQSRNELNGPGLAVSALVKNYAFLTFLLLCATAKSDALCKMSTKPVCELFAHSIKDFMDAKDEVDATH
jgi:hypothetical protein